MKEWRRKNKKSTKKTTKKSFKKQGMAIKCFILQEIFHRMVHKLENWAQVNISKNMRGEGQIEK